MKSSSHYSLTKRAIQKGDLGDLGSLVQSVLTIVRLCNLSMIMTGEISIRLNVIVANRRNPDTYSTNPSSKPNISSAET